jgi:predicted ATPase
MITNIRLSNFRAFQSAVDVRIRPITVLIGKNSAGKSSLIKFLLMLRQTLESHSDQFFVTDGKDVKLGTWLDLRHTNTREGKHYDSYLRYRIDVETEDLPSPEIQAMWQAVSKTQFVTSEGDRVRVNLEFKKESLRKESSRAKFGIDGRVHYGREFKYGAHEVIGWWNNQTRGFRQRAVGLKRNRFLRFSERTDSISKLVEGVAAEQFLDTLRQEFLTPRYLSPIREESQRVVQAGSPPPRDVGQKGEFAIPHLAEILKNPDRKDQASFIKKYAASVAHVEGITPQRRFAKMLTEIKGRNPETQADCPLADFGFGVSQCLPIFVQGAMHHRGQLLIVEQPEAQLHPTAQLELGSFFAELWKDRGVPSIIETHSPNVLLRLRRLVSKGELQASDVSVAFFTIGKGARPRQQFLNDLLERLVGERGEGFPAVVVKNLDINPDGSLGSKDQGLPMEFFGADVIEALEIGTTK